MSNPALLLFLTGKNEGGGMMTEVGTLRRDAILLTEDTADVVVDPAVLVDTESLQTVSGEGLVAPGKGICVKN